MAHREIQKFNQQLINDGEVITIVDYVKKLNMKFFHIDLSFIDDFIELVNNDGFVIQHEMLFKYEILTKSDSAQVLRLLENNNFEDGVDYSCTTAGVDD